MRRIVTVLALVFVLAPAAIAVVLPENLEGVREFYVLVERMKNEAPITMGRVKTVAELRLRQLGLPLENSKETPLPYLYINLQTMKHKLQNGNTTGYAAVIRLDFNTFGRLLHSSNTITTVSIWSDTLLVLTDLDDAEQNIERSLIRLVDKFANDYMKRNPNILDIEDPSVD